MRRERQPRGHMTHGTAPRLTSDGDEGAESDIISSETSLWDQNLFLESARLRGPRCLCLSHALKRSVTAAAAGSRGA